MPKFKDLTGQRFGRLTVLSRAQNAPNGSARWLCRCDCGNEKTVSSGNLLNGNTRSCSCLLSEISSANMRKSATKHGMSRTPLYHVWQMMVSRCYRPSTASFKNYGGRGIQVCDEWKASFIPFYSWAVANGYRKGLEIDRINNDGNYEPSNCRWVSKAENHKNKRNCIPIEITDIQTGHKCTVRTIAEASKITGISCTVLSLIVEGKHKPDERFLLLKSPPRE